MCHREEDASPVARALRSSLILRLPPLAWKDECQFFRLRWLSCLIIYILRNTHQKAMSYIFVRKCVLANQRSERWFSHVKKMISPIRIANHVFSRVRKMIRSIRTWSHRGVWVSCQNSRLLLQLVAPLRLSTHSTRKVLLKEFFSLKK